MCAFVNNLFLHSRESIEDDSSGAALYIVYRSLTQGDGDKHRDRILGDGIERSCHFERCGQRKGETVME